MIRYIERAAVLISMLMLITACGSVPTLDVEPSVSDDTAVDVDSEDTGLRLPPRETNLQTKKSASAVDQLLVQAQSAIADESLGKASALVERAIRLAPQDARAYFSLAQVRYRQDQKGQAQSLAQKARALVVDDNALLAAIVQFQKGLMY
jgi:tetratricopeptide (TPR) repeat protein